MRFIEKRLFLKSGLIFCAIQALLYIPVHLSYTGVISEDGGTAAVIFGALTSALSELAAFALPVIAGMILFLSYAYKGAPHAIPRVFFFSLPYLVCSVPANYLNYLAWFDTSGAIFFSFLISLFVLITVTAQMLALFGVICFFFRLPKEKRFDRSSLSPIESEDMFDFSNPLSKGIFGAVIVQFVITLVPELIETVTYFIERSGTYRTGELFTIVFTYLFMAAEILITYIVAYKLKNRIVYERLAEPVEND